MKDMKSSNVTKEGAIVTSSGPDTSGHSSMKGDGSKIPKIGGGTSDLSATLSGGKANQGGR